MQLPEYFANIPSITLHDPLAELLGVPADGLIAYRFADAVKLAGHCCPTVAGAWLMTTRALRVLYGEATPERGRIAVSLGEAADSGVAGVIASIATLLTGAAGEGGFKGLGGGYRRRDLLRFGVIGVIGLRFTRLDTGATVDAVFRPNSELPDPRLGQLMPAVVSGSATAEQAALFRELWQDRVRRLLEAGDAVVEIRAPT